MDFSTARTSLSQARAQAEQLIQTNGKSNEQYQAMLSAYGSKKGKSASRIEDKNYTYAYQMRTEDGTLQFALDLTNGHSVDPYSNNMKDLMETGDIAYAKWDKDNDGNFDVFIEFDTYGKTGVPGTIKTDANDDGNYETILNYGLYNNGARLNGTQKFDFDDDGNIDYSSDYFIGKIYSETLYEDGKMVYDVGYNDGIVQGFAEELGDKVTCSKQEDLYEDGKLAESYYTTDKGEQDWKYNYNEKSGELKSIEKDTDADGDVDKINDKNIFGKFRDRSAKSVLDRLGDVFMAIASS